MQYALYYASSPAPKNLDRETLRRLVAVHFTTAPEIEEKCRPTLEMFKRALNRKPEGEKR